MRLTGIVDERAWIDVIDNTSGDCRFVYYAYAQYGITHDDSRIKVPVGLPPGMSIAEPINSTAIRSD